MSDLIKDDIEKIERALNICLDDIQFESTFNSSYFSFFLFN